MGGICDCTALYADDMLLFLEDPGPSLEAVFEMLGTFAKFSGLRVNWEKSNIMTIDDGAQARASPLVPIAWVSEIKYLGVRVSPQLTDYLSLNLMLLLTKVKTQLDAWKHLPLSLIGRVNFLKMKVLPVFLYFLRNTPMWVPCSFFKHVNSLFCSFLWCSGHPRVGLSTLQEPYGQGGLAFHCLFKYFLAGQLVIARPWLVRDDGDAATVLEAALVGSYESLCYLVHRGPQVSAPLRYTTSQIILSKPQSCSSLIMMYHALSHMPLNTVFFFFGGI